MASRRAGARRTGRFSVTTAAWFALPLCSALLSLWTIQREQATRLAERRLEDQTVLLAAPDAPQARPIPAIPAWPTARLLLADALYFAREAARTADPQWRGVLVARADTELAAALKQRPSWGEAHVTAAFIAGLRTPADPDAERRALVRSYADAPFLQQSGFWRVERSLIRWYDLPALTRRKVVEEAAWLLRDGESGNRAILFDIVRGSPAYRPIFLRWRELES